MSFESQAERLTDAANNKDGYTAANIFKEVGLCHISDLMNEYKKIPGAPILILTDLGEAKGGEFLSLGAKNWNMFNAGSFSPLAPQFIVRDCDK